MKAAVVRSFDAPPRYEDFELPPSVEADDVVIHVLAAGLHQRVRSSASGSHYADSPVLPMIPGIDAGGRLPDRQLVYCVVHDTPYGTMAEQVVVDRRRCVPLPEGIDEAIVAAAMNPAMSSWIALRLRAPIQQGQSVFVLGATGNAGRMAIPIAKLLGAARVVAAGREIARLDSSGADEVVSLVGEPQSVAAAIAKAASESDIVLDYLWGKPAADAMVALLTGRRDRGRRINWIQIGSVAGLTMALRSVALRSTNLCVMGSGQGSVPTKVIVAELPRLASEVLAASIPITCCACRYLKWNRLGRLPRRRDSASYSFHEWGVWRPSGAPPPNSEALPQAASVRLEACKSTTSGTGPLADCVSGAPPKARERYCRPDS